MKLSLCFLALVLAVCIHAASADLGARVFVKNVTVFAPVSICGNQGRPGQGQGQGQGATNITLPFLNITIPISNATIPDITNNTDTNSTANSTGLSYVMRFQLGDVTKDLPMKSGCQVSWLGPDAPLEQQQLTFDVLNQLAVPALNVSLFRVENDTEVLEQSSAIDLNRYRGVPLPASLSAAGSDKSLAQFLLTYDVPVLLSANNSVTQETAASFAPAHRNTSALYYINGDMYFAAVLSAIQQAQSEIYISGVCLSPDLLLARSAGNTVRLDSALQQAAAKGVKVYIFVYGQSILGDLIPAANIDIQNIQQNLGSSANYVILSQSPNASSSDLLGGGAWFQRQKTVVIDQKLAFVGSMDLCHGRFDTAQHVLKDNAAKEEQQLYPGVDYWNPNVVSAGTGNQSVVGSNVVIVDRNTIPRLPWHDLAISVDGLAASDVALDFIQRWNKQAPVFNASLPNLVWSNYSSNQPNNTNNPNATTPGNSTFPVNSSVPTNETDQTPPPTSDMATEGTGQDRCQVVRSMSTAFGGKFTEASLYSRMITMIRSAQAFVYIEAQYLVLSQANAAGKTQVQHILGELLLNRTRDAILSNSSFHVYIVMPLVSAGGLQQDAARGILYLELQSLLNGPNSFLGKLKNLFPAVDLTQYVTLSTLRTYDFFAFGAGTTVPGGNSTDNGNSTLPSDNSTLPSDNSTLPVDNSTAPTVPTENTTAATSEIYVHSNVLIVDDRAVLISSAEINDRSLLGDRDSHVGIYCDIEPDMNPDGAQLVTFNGKTFAVSKFVHNLRMALMSEQLLLPIMQTSNNSNSGSDSGSEINPNASTQTSSTSPVAALSGIDTADPLAPEFIAAYNGAALNNSQIYQNVFPNVPSDNATSWTAFQSAASLPNDVSLLSGIKSFLVQFPMFLANDSSLWPSDSFGALPGNNAGFYLSHIEHPHDLA